MLILFTTLLEIKPKVLKCRVFKNFKKAADNVFFMKVKSGKKKIINNSIHVQPEEFPKILTLQYKICLGPAGQSGVQTVHSASPVEADTSGHSSDCNHNQLIHSIQGEGNQQLDDPTSVTVGQHGSRTATVWIGMYFEVVTSRWATVCLDCRHRGNPLSVKAA